MKFKKRITKKQILKDLVEGFNNGHKIGRKVTTRQLIDYAIEEADLTTIERIDEDVSEREEAKKQTRFND